MALLRLPQASAAWLSPVDALAQHFFVSFAHGVPQSKTHDVIRPIGQHHPGQSA